MTARGARSISPLAGNTSAHAGPGTGGRRPHLPPLREGCRWGRPRVPRRPLTPVSAQLLGGLAETVSRVADRASPIAGSTSGSAGSNSRAAECISSGAVSTSWVAQSNSERVGRISVVAGWISGLAERMGGFAPALSGVSRRISGSPVPFPVGPGTRPCPLLGAPCTPEWTLRVLARPRPRVPRHRLTGLHSVSCIRCARAPAFWPGLRNGRRRRPVGRGRSAGQVNRVARPRPVAPPSIRTGGGAQ